MRKVAFYRVINSELSADKFTADKQTRDKQTSKQANKQTSKQADKQTSRQANKQTSRRADKQTRDEADNVGADPCVRPSFYRCRIWQGRQVYSKRADEGRVYSKQADKGEADDVGADPCVRPPFYRCRILQGRHTGLPLQQRLQLAHNTSRYIMKSSKCGENDMRLVATRKVFFIH